MLNLEWITFSDFVLYAKKYLFRFEQYLSHLFKKASEPRVPSCYVEVITFYGRHHDLLNRNGISILSFPNSCLVM
jgi:hypothetical protein